MAANLDLILKTSFDGVQSVCKSGSLKKVISEDALRNALQRIPEAEGEAWLDGHLAESVAPLLDAPWILDIDTPVKPLYGKQEGALISYNPKKPGRPSHSYHTYLMAGLSNKPFQRLNGKVRNKNEVSNDDG